MISSVFYLVLAKLTCMFLQGFFPMKALPQKHENNSIPSAPSDSLKLSQLLKEEFVTLGDRISSRFTLLQALLVLPVISMQKSN